MINTEILLSNTGKKISIIGEKVRGNAWYSLKNNINTIEMIFTNFKGRVGIQCTLEKEPNEDDWFFIYLNTTKEYIEAPDKNGLPLNGKKIFHFRGNFTWIRAIMDRKNISHPIDENNVHLFGFINRILILK
jgi:hypothetical protein